MGLRIFTGELAGYITDHFYFHILFRYGGECGTGNPLLRSRPFYGMIRVVDVVRPTAAAISTL